MRQASLNNWRNPDYRKQQIESHKEYTKTHGLNTTGLKGHVTISKSVEKQIWYDSSWEKTFLEFCDTLEFIQNIDRPDFYIPYVYEDEDRYYYPDFLLSLSSSKSILVEIKANWMIEHDGRTREKLRVGKEYVDNSETISEYLVLTEDQLFTDPACNKFNSSLIEEIIKKLNS